MGQSSIINSLAVLQNGYLASGSDDKTIMICDSSTGSLIRTMQSNRGTIKSLAVLQNDLVIW